MSRHDFSAPNTNSVETTAAGRSIKTSPLVNRLLFERKLVLARMLIVTLLMILVWGPGLLRRPVRAAVVSAPVQGDGLTAEGVVLDFDTGSHKAGEVISLGRIFREDGTTPALVSLADNCPSRHLHGTIKIKDCKTGMFEGPFTDPFAKDSKNECGHGKVVANRADVSIAVTARTIAAVGDAITYTLTVTNNGPHIADFVIVAADAVALDDARLDNDVADHFEATFEGLDFISGPKTGRLFGLPANPSISRQVSCTLRITDPQFIRSGSLSATFRVLGLGNCGVDPLSFIDPNSSNNTASATTSILRIDPATANVRWISALYLNALNRPVDPAALTASENLLTGGHTRQEVALGVLTSSEARQNLVALDYQAILNRVPASGELANSLSLLGTATDEQFLAQTLFGSSEYFSLSGGTNDNFITQVYIDSLGRVPSGDDRTAALNQFNGGETPQQVALAILLSQEYRKNRVREIFQKYSHRTPTSGELDGFATFFGLGGTDEQVGAQLIGSDEFLQLYPALPFPEGSNASVVIGTFTTPNTGIQVSDLKVTITWGDGSSSNGTLTSRSAGSGVFFVSGSHAYSDPGPFSTSCQITDPAANTTTLSNPVFLFDAPLFPARTRISVSPAVTSSVVVATFVDLNQSAISSNYTAQIDWGDGTSTSTGTITPNNNPSGFAPEAAAAAFKVSGSHTFATAGEYAVNVTITDKSGSTATAHSRASVGPDFSLSFDSPTVTAQAGTKARVSVNINRTGGFTGSVTVTPPPPANGIKAKPADPINTTDPSAVFKMKIGGGVSPGQYPLTFTAQDSSGKTHTGTVTLVVQ